MSSAKATVVGMIRRGEMKVLGSGTAIYEFSIPVEKRWVDKQSGEKKEKTSWQNMKAFGRTAENIEKFIGVGKGGIFFGDIEVEEWESDQGKRSKTVINVQSFDFAPVSKADSEGSSSPQQSASQRAQAPQQANNNTRQPADNFDNFDDD